MARSALTIKIDEAVALLQRNDMLVTPESVRANLDPGWDDVQGIAESAIQNAVRNRLKVTGLIIADAVTGERKEFGVATVAELREQLRVKEESNIFDRNRIKADKAVIVFLEEKERDFGYEVCPDLFHDEIDRIYRMHSLTAPWAKEAVG